MERMGGKKHGLSSMSVMRTLHIIVVFGKIRCGVGVPQSSCVTYGKGPSSFGVVCFMMFSPSITTQRCLVSSQVT